MPTVVVDASAVAAIIFSESRAMEVARQIEGRDLVAPLLLRHELVSVGLKKLRAQPDERRAIRYNLRTYTALRIV